MSAWVWIAVAAVGGLGAIVRFLLDGVLGGYFGLDFPLGTLTVNLSAAFLLGLLTGLAFSGNVLVIADTATLGSYSTFSTWMLETHRLAEDREWTLALVNIVLSLLAGFGAALLGRSIGLHL